MTANRQSLNLDGSLFLGIDVGGTDVKFGIVTVEGQLLESDRVSTGTLKTPQKVFKRAMSFAKASIKDDSKGRKLHGVGLAVPGVLDSRELIIREVVNLPGWLDVPLQTLLAEASELPTAILNDANAAAYAEHTRRNLGDRSLALVTLGTGVGSGLVLAGKPFGGDAGCAGELGHITVDFTDDSLPCTCGSRGHLETYAGSGGVMRRFDEKVNKANTKDAGAFEARPQVESPRDIALLAESGDEIAKNVIMETGQYVGRAIGLIGQVADPSVVLIGGAMTFGGNQTDTGQLFLDSIQAAVNESTLVQVSTNMQIEFATLGNQAGMIGAAMAARANIL